jgi:hypothetical protein
MVTIGSWEYLSLKETDLFHERMHLAKLSDHTPTTVGENFPHIVSQVYIVVAWEVDRGRHLLWRKWRAKKVQRGRQTGRN